MSNASHKSGIVRAFRSRNFQLFWVGAVANNLGVWISRLAIAWLTWDLTHSTAWLGVMGAGSMVPILFLGPISGATADRHGYRFQLISSTIIGGLITTAAATLVVTDIIFPELLLALVLGRGITQSFDVPARNALVHSLVDKADLSAAIGVNAATYQGLRFVGPAVGGFLLVAGGPGWALYGHAGLAFFTGAFLLMLRIDGEGRAKAARGQFFSELVAGFRYTYRHGGIRVVMLMTAVTTLFLEPYFEMLPAFADEVFKLGEQGVGPAHVGHRRRCHGGRSVARPAGSD
ncbi:MAG: MFS transporter [Rhodospirillales bacterium]|jgi:MFS family permease|nr:MFS transporter [Rhodospirillales bacterium]